MSFCIPKNIAEGLKLAAKNGEITIERISNMSSKERRELFAKYTNEEMGKEISLGFEKAISSSREEVLIDWVKNTFEGKEKKVIEKRVLAKLEQLKEGGLLDEGKLSVYEDLISEKLGLNIKPEEVIKLKQLGDEVVTLEGKRSALGLHTPEYFKALDKVRRYMDRITPDSKLAIASSFIGRGNLLFKTASSVLNVSNNTVQGLFQGIKRRIRDLTISGYDKDLVFEYVKESRRIWKESRFDISRIINPNADLKILGERMLTPEGDSWIHKTAQFYEDVVFNKMLGTPDNLYASFARADSAMILSSEYVKKIEGLSGDAAKKRIRELFLETIRPDAEISDIASIIRDKSIFDSKVSTSTQEGNFEQVSSGARQLLNKATGDLRLGDQIIPFVKTPSNVISKSLDTTGITIPYKLLTAVKAVKDGISTKEAFKDVLETGIEAGLGMTSAVILVNILKPEDFIGTYPTNEAERELIRSGNATTNSFKTKDGKWVSLDYLGPLAAPFLAVMYAKKSSSFINTLQGAASPILGLPGIEELITFFKDTMDIIDPEKGITPEKATQNFKKSFLDFLSSRIIPGFVSDLAKASDPYQREVGRGDISDTFAAKFPGTTRLLPVKKNIFGDELKNESIASVLLFGARVKTAVSTPEMLELERLHNTGNTVGITNIQKNSDRVKLMKEMMPEDKYKEFIDKYQSELKKKIQDEIKKNSYKKLSDEEKANKLDKIEADLLERQLEKSNYKKYKKQKEKKNK